MFDNGDSSLLTLLNTSIDDISVNSFYDADVEAPDDLFLLGLL